MRSRADMQCDEEHWHLELAEAIINTPHGCYIVVHRRDCAAPDGPCCCVPSVLGPAVKDCWQ